MRSTKSPKIELFTENTAEREIKGKQVKSVPNKIGPKSNRPQVKSFPVKSAPTQIGPKSNRPQVKLFPVKSAPSQIVPSQIGPRSNHSHSNRPQIKSTPGQIVPSQIVPRSNRIQYVIHVYVVYMLLFCTSYNLYITIIQDITCPIIAMQVITCTIVIENTS